MIAALRSRGVYQSVDGGLHWNHLIIQSSLISIGVVAFSDDPWNSMIAGGARLKGTGGAAISHDGIIWTDISNGLPLFGSVYAIMARDFSLYAGTPKGVYRFDLGGNEWQPSNLGILTSYVYSLAQQPLFILAGTLDDGIFRSGDGMNWTAVNDGLEIANTTFTSIAFDGTRTFAAASGDHGGVYLSTDNGDHWAAINGGFPSGIEINALAVSDGYLFAGTVDHGVYRRSLSEITGINEINYDNSVVTVYPNPTDGKFSISISPDDQKIIKGEVEVHVYSSSGQLVLNNNYVVSEAGVIADVDASSFTHGIYFIEIRSALFGRRFFKMVMIY